MNRKSLLIVISLVVVAAIGTASFYVMKNKDSSQADNQSGSANLVEIFYLPHPPAEAIVKKVEPIIAQFPQFQIEEYSFIDPQNASLIKSYGITEHMPIAIFIGGKDEFDLNGKHVVLKNFPEGDSFVPTYSGDWSYDDLRQILNLIK